MSNLVGKLLGKYEITERLGLGGMAEVYRAHQINLDRDVAIKVMHPHLVEGENFIKRFRQEATAIARLRHPHIVQIYDFDVEADIYYMVMELIDGVTLKTELDRRQVHEQPFTVIEAARLFSALAGAVDYAHRQGMVHRDLKPANVMLNRESQVVLTDFGIAKILRADHLTITGSITGTPAYMSPEQGQGGEADERSDIYSLGAILYELLTGRIPFEGETPFATILKHITAPPPLPSQFRPDLPPAVEHVILKAMNKDPNTRYQTAGEMAHALQIALGSAPAPPLQPSPLISPVPEPDNLVVQTIADLAGLPEPGLPPAAPHFTGRTAELARLAGQLNRRHIVVLTGSPGAGKTALAAKLVQAAAAPRHTFWYTCREDEALEAILWQLAGFLTRHDQAELWQMLNIAHASGADLPPVARLSHYVRHHLQGQDFLLCFDHLPRLETDSPLAQFLQQLGDLAQAGQLSLLITTRQTPSFLPPDVSPAVTGLTLAETEAVLARFKVTLPGDQLARLHALTGGNAQLLLLSGQVLPQIETPAAWLTRLAAGKDLARELLIAADQTLTEGEREVMLAVALLAGYPAGAGALKAILGDNFDQQTLRTLSERHLLTFSGDKTNRVFSQPALLQTFYEEQLNHDEGQQIMHLRAAQYFETHPQYLLQAAYHYDRAGLPRWAAELATEATPALLNQGQAQPLGRLLARFSPAQLTPFEWAAVNLALGQVYTRLEQPQAAQENFQAALAGLEAAPDEAETADLTARTCLAMGCLQAARAPAEALAWLRRGLATSGASDPAQQAELQLHLGRLLLQQGDYPAALQATRQALDLLPPQAGTHQINALNQLGLVYFHQNKVDPAIEQWTRALQLCRQVFDLYRPLELQYNLGRAKMIGGDGREALEALETGLTLAERWGHVSRRLAFHLKLGQLYRRQGDEAAAERHLTTLLALARAQNLPEAQIEGQAALVELYLGRDQIDEAAALLAELARQIPPAGATVYQTCRYRLQAQVELVRSQPKTAWDLAKQALNLARETKSPLEEGLSLAVLGQTLLANDQAEAALVAFERSVELLTGPAPYEAARVRVEWGRYLFWQEKTEIGQQLLEEARATFARLGAQADVARVDEVLAASAW